MANVSLLSSNNHIETPYIKVTIGDYTFGVYDKSKSDYDKYPNYVTDLSITKINGQVNTYDLTLEFQISEYDDPNYFEKIFSAVSESRKISFTYGDMSIPSFVYKNEEGIITKVSSKIDVYNSKIVYNVSAISQANLLTVGAYSFPAKTGVKPSDEIKRILNEKQYGLQEIFTGMRNMTLVNQYNLIPGNDIAVNLYQKNNISILDYLTYLVNCMSDSSTESKTKKSSVYIMTFVDDTSGVFDGSYFKIIQVDASKSHPEAYDLTIGYPSANVITSFDIEDNENYSIYYNYQNKLNSASYVNRINEVGEFEDVYCPVLSSKNDMYETRDTDKTWWTKVTEYPIKASITIKGLLRPAILMSYVRLNTFFFGKKHISSGLWIVTKQQDRIGVSTFTTTLNLTKIAGDEE